MEEIHSITSRDNAKIKHAKSVRDGRDETMIFIEGVRLAVVGQLEAHEAQSAQPSSPRKAAASAPLRSGAAE